MSSSTIHNGLPEDVISQILASFCDGKSISTFFHVLWSCHALRSTSFEGIRSTLVHRYRSTAGDDRLKPNRFEEMRDVIAFVREDVRTATVDIETGRLRGGDGDRIGDSNKPTITLVSEWCAIVDYFDLALNLDEHVVWVGGLDTRFGRLDSVCIRTPFWTITSMQFFYGQAELACEALVPPNPTSSHGHLLGRPYGHLAALTDTSIQVMDRLRDSLSIDEVSNRYSLVLSHLEYEEEIPFVFTPTPNDKASNYMLQHGRELQCLWDGQDECDFDESLVLLGENVVRILQRLEQAKKQAMDDGIINGSGSAYCWSWRRIIGSELTPFDDASLL